MTCPAAAGGNVTLDEATWRDALALLARTFEGDAQAAGLVSHAEMIGDDLEAWGFLRADDPRPLTARRIAGDILTAIASDIYNVADEPDGNPGMRPALYAAAGAWLAATTARLGSF